MEKLFEDAKKYAGIVDFFEASYEQLIIYNKYIKQNKEID